MFNPALRNKLIRIKRVSECNCTFTYDHEMTKSSMSKKDNQRLLRAAS